MRLDGSNKIIIVLAISFASGDFAYAASEQTSTIVYYQRHIEELKSKHGVYYARLGEPLLGLSLAYQLEDEHEQAAIMLKQALQIKRVNHGLYDLGQIPILERLVKSNIANEHWSDVDRNYHQMLWVHKRNYGGNDPQLLTILDRVACWKLKAYRQSLLNDNLHDPLYEAGRIYSGAITMLSSRDQTDPRLIDPLYGRVLVNYQMTSSEVGNTLRRVVSIYEANTELPKNKYAEALAHLGDWELLTGSSEGAHNNYKKAYTLLVEDAAEREHLDQLFGSPKVIPSLKITLPELDEHQQNNADLRYVYVSLDVSENGKPGNIKILDGDPAEKSGDKGKAKREIQSRRYRPRYEDGESVATSDHQMRVVQSN